jgi:hypothetical protein
MEEKTCVASTQISCHFNIFVTGCVYWCSGNVNYVNILGVLQHIPSLLYRTLIYFERKKILRNIQTERDAPQRSVTDGAHGCDGGGGGGRGGGRERVGRFFLWGGAHRAHASESDARWRGHIHTHSFTHSHSHKLDFSLSTTKIQSFAKA